MITFIQGCSPPKRTAAFYGETVFDNPKFYYDKENTVLIRVNPATREQEIAAYEKEKHSIVPDSSKISSFTREDGPPPIKSLVIPYYPDKAKNFSCQGTVVLLLRIENVSGIVDMARMFAYYDMNRKQKTALDAVEMMLVESALQAAIQTVFITEYFDFPIRFDEEGKPEPYYIYYPVRFVMENGEPGARYPPRLAP
jgi:hypothetical protein